jgi:hypothetical protein
MKKSPSHASRILVIPTLLLAVFALQIVAAQDTTASPTPAKRRGLFDFFRGSPPSTNATTASTTLPLTQLSPEQMTLGLKEALGRGLDQAIASLGRTNGFFTNLNVRIPMPQSLRRIENTLRSVGQDRIADNFILTLNQAAEQAVPAAAEVFTESLRNMSVADARKILTGPDDAATRYFQDATRQELGRRFLPIVQDATSRTGATAAYKQVVDRTKSMGPLLRTPVVDVDTYVTEKAMDGLFTLVAEEERRIRENPAARSTELLRSVFGTLRR